MTSRSVRSGEPTPTLTGGPELYHWEDLPELNVVVKKVFAAAELTVLDTGPLALLRPDAHTGENHAGKMDCLHNILPGLPDTYSRLLYSFLASRATQARSELRRRKRPSWRPGRTT
mmetsp:Transcript_48286/g.113486  ORF Transcript_48286/g.113486 Transcript_48286/m.113486 type:complete len:116 (-) Transcript_48286:234-581(-)